MISDLYSQKSVSSYNPSKEVKDFTSTVKNEYIIGDEILNRSWVELNNRSVVDDMNRGQRTFNAFVDESTEDVTEAWKWRGTRSKARNKAIALHTHITAGYIFPSFVAQNDDDEEDRDFSEMMTDCVEWLGVNSNYKQSFLNATLGMLVNPVTYLGAEWCQVYQTIKEKQEDGSYKEKEILDEVLSGFNAPVYSADQILISNAYEQNTQRQRFTIKRRYIEYKEAEAHYCEHENWKYLTPGIKAIYNSDDGLFYDVKDDQHPFLVEEVIYINRRDDTEVCFLNGIYFGDTNIEANPIRHRDNRGAPKYNIVPFGYQRINEHFFFYKSLMNCQYWDNQLLDAQYELGMNTAMLVANMPMGFSGVEGDISSDIAFPSAVVTFKDPNVKGFPLFPNSNPAILFNVAKETERSIEESSISDTTGGQLPPGDTKATSVAIAAQNAKVMLQGVGKTVAESVIQYGSLMADIVINNLSTAQVDEIAGETSKLKYKTLLLKDKTINGKQVDKMIRFDEYFLGNEMDEQQKRYVNLKLLESTKYPDHTQHVYLVNPLKFSMAKYLSRVEPEQLFAKNEEYQQAIYSQVYAQFANNPFVSLEELTRETLYTYFKSKTDKIMKTNQEMQPMSSLDTVQQNNQPPQTQFGQQVQNSAVGRATLAAGFGPGP